MNRKMRRAMGRANRRYTRLGGPALADATETIKEEILGLPLRTVDEAKALPRPKEVTKFYPEAVAEIKASEQALLWEAEGVAAARPFEVEAADRRMAAKIAESLVVIQDKATKTARDGFELSLRTLGPYTRRPPGEKGPYYLRWALILGGDIAGVAGAAILLGETVELGLLQAISSGTAAITSGLVAHEVKDSRLARKRQKPSEKLSPDEKKFAHLFKGGDSGEQIVKWAVGGALVIGVAIAGSIFALRLTTEGSTAGWAFGLLAAAVALASWANVYHFTDEVADLIDARRADYKGENKRQQKLSQNENISRRDAATAEAASIKEEAAKRGQAAVKETEATAPQLLTGNPGIAGHGWAKETNDQEGGDEGRQEDTASATPLPGVETADYVPPEVAVDGAGNGRGLES